MAAGGLSSVPGFLLHSLCLPACHPYRAGLPQTLTGAQLWTWLMLPARFPGSAPGPMLTPVAQEVLGGQFLTTPGDTPMADGVNH